jgi:hypothetical protein
MGMCGRHLHLGQGSNPPRPSTPNPGRFKRFFRGPLGFSEDFVSVELAGEVDKILEKKLLGYRSRAEFVAEAVRDKLIQVKKS